MDFTVHIWLVCTATKDALPSYAQLGAYFKNFAAFLITIYKCSVH
jgi:hypothetical protein